MNSLTGLDMVVRKSYNAKFIFRGGNIMKYNKAKKIKVGNNVMIKDDDSTFLITGIRRYETLIVFESDGGEFDHKDVDCVI